VFAYFSERTNSFEVIVVDDGSTDNTISVLNLLKAKYPNLRVLGYPHNEGKGYAVKFGVINSLGSLVLMLDADGATPVEEYSKLENMLKLGASIVIASRAIPTSETILETSLHRKVLGRVFNLIVNLLCVPGVSDTQCGFKLFTREAADIVFSLQTIYGFAFDCELLFIARRKGIPLSEVSVNWVNISGSKVNMIRDPLVMFFEIILIRYRAIMGWYD